MAKKKSYNALIRIEFRHIGIEASSKEKAKQYIKDSIYDQYGLRIDDIEIIELFEE